MGGYVKCRSCDGLGKKWIQLKPRRGELFGGTKDIPCRACDGSGINYKLRAANCRRCGCEIVYPAGSTFEPQYCRSCKVAQKAEKDAKWRTKSCPGIDTFGCSNVIKYSVDWDSIPELCPQCREKKRLKREQRLTNMREKPCPGFEGNCCPNNNIIRWDISKNPNGFALCRQCSDRKKAEWYIQSEDEHAIVKVKGDYSHSTVRTDFLVVDKTINKHKHFSIEEEKDSKLEDYHDWKK